MKKKLDKYGYIDKHVVADPRIPVGPKALYALLCCYTDKFDQCFPANALLAQQLGCDTRTITRYFDTLQSWGILTRSPTGYNKSYTVKIHHGDKIKNNPQWSPEEGSQLCLTNI